ncbi:MAG: hypothetical protein ABW202_02525 [Duganella sp.]
MNKWLQGRRGALFFLLLGIGLVAVFMAMEWRFPASSQLQTASGRVEWTHEGRGAIYFALRGTPQQFVVHTKIDGGGKLRAALASASGVYGVSVRYHPGQTNHPGYLPGDFYVAYGLAVGGKEVSSLAEVRASYRRDNLVALVLGLVFAVMGGLRLRLKPFSAGRAGGGTPASRRSR